MKRTGPVLAFVLLAGCGGAEPQGEAATPAYTPPDAEPPVAVNAESPIQYPPALYDRKIEGDVVLRLFVDSTGRLAPESTRVAESSGYPALDSAALAGATRLRFAPARRRGIPVATSFVQPIEFRHPERAVLRGGP
ncbi:MAG TPA: energy transducer TonB [Gemmatimonadales bacterium]